MPSSSSSSLPTPRPDFTSILASYRTLDLPSLQSLLSSLTSPHSNLQAASLASRKSLADQTREFKKLPDEEKLESYKPLLKSYQVEIDGLTKRAREAEGGLRRVEERLDGVVDPVEVLEKVLDQTANLSEVQGVREEAEALKRENERLRANVESMGQLEAERDQLTQRVGYLERTFEKSVAETRTSVEKEVTARFEERVSNLTSKEEDLTRSLSSAQEQLKQLRTSHESTTQRLLSSSTSASSSSASASGGAEYEMLASDLQRANERVAVVEKRNESLREEVERVKSGRLESAQITKLQAELTQLSEERTRMQKTVKGQDEKWEKEVQALQRNVEQVKKTIGERDAEVATLKQKLDSQADYPEMKRELEILRIVEFSSGLDDDDDDDEDADAAETSKSKMNAKPLEALLLEKNKKLQEELTTMRVAHSELSTSSTRSGKELESLRQEVERLKKLNEKLEGDLVSVQVGVGPSSHGKAAATVNGTTSKTDPAAQMSAEDALAEMDRIEKSYTGQSPSATLAMPAQPKTTSSSSSTTPKPTSAQDGSGDAPSTAVSSSSSSVLPIIISQRDRFRTRNAELEEELRKQFEVITTLRSEVKKLQSDNLSLYEKVRYLSSYSNSSGSTHASGSNHGLVSAAARNQYPPSSSYDGASPSSSNHVKVPMNLASASAGPGAGEDHYRSLYDASLNPFEAFRGREQSRALSSLNPLEKLLHMLSQWILADRRMRIGFMVYAVGMHLFVFGIMVDYTFLGTGTGTGLGKDTMAAVGQSCAVAAAAAAGGAGGAGAGEGPVPAP